MDEEQPLEEEVIEEEAVEEVKDVDEDTIELEQKLEEAEEAKRQLTARAHKAEAEVKSLKDSTPEAPQEEITSNALSADDVDTKILQSQGMSEDLVDKLKRIAQIEGTSILAAQENDIFKEMKAKAELDDRNAKAALGASKGSGARKGKKTTSTPNLSNEDHREIWNQANGR